MARAAYGLDMHDHLTLRLRRRRGRPCSTR